MSRLPSSPESSGPPDPTESTETLIRRVRTGDTRALEQVARRYLPGLRKWARGRLPAHARDMIDTDDLVQVTMVRALDRVKEFDSQRPGAFFAYLRQILVNQIRDQIRRTGRVPVRADLDEGLPDPGASPLEMAIGNDALERFEAALKRLSASQREAIVLRVEVGLTYEDLAEALGKSTPNAARLYVSRALLLLAKEMHEST